MFVKMYCEAKYVTDTTFNNLMENHDKKYGDNSFY